MNPERLGELVDVEQEPRQLGEGYWFTEGPAWNHRDQFLMFSDIPADTRYRWSEGDGVSVAMKPNFKGNGMVFEPDGSYLVCEQVSSCVRRFRPDGSSEVVAFHYQGKYLNSPNDIVTHSDGSIYFTDPNYGRWKGDFGCGREPELDFQGVFRVPPGGGDCELVVPKGEFEQPNGLCFSPDESLLYVNDSPPGDVKVFPVNADGSLGEGRLFFGGIGKGDIGEGTPDGMKCDELGNLWCTGPKGVWVIDTEGELLGIVPTPEVVGNIVWGGEDLKTLLMTTSSLLLSVRTKVAAGALPYH
jgi:gluconolactonase